LAISSCLEEDTANYPDVDASISFPAHHSCYQPARAGL
jgi:hypothetical protein